MPQALSEHLERLAALKGLMGCAVVEYESGMVIASAGAKSLVPVAEAATDHWTLHQRRDQFAGFGRARAQVLIQETARITLTPCGGRFVLVSFSAEPDAVPWTDWKLIAAELHQMTLDF